MKKMCTMILAALCAVSMSAQMRIWYNGQKLSEINLSMIDSITFVKSGEPVNPDTPDPQPVTTFDYDHWREQTDIRIYNTTNNTWSWKHLPWDTAEAVSVTMPEAYRYPNKAFHNDSTPVWELAFNTFPDSTLDYEHMFGLWDKRSQVMSVYAYIQNLPNTNATYCFYNVTTSTSCFVEPDTRVFMPSDSILRNKNHWNFDAIFDEIAWPTTTSTIVQPIQRDVRDGQNMPINSGWVCFDLDFGSGQFNLPENGTISITMYAVDQMTIEGTDTLSLALNCENCEASGQIITPANKHKKAAGNWTTTGALFSGLASSVAEGISAGKDATTEVGAAVGVAGAIGAICSAVGGYMTASQEADTTKSNVKLGLTMDFQGTASGQFNGTLASIIGTGTGGVTMSYKKFFEGRLNHAGGNRAPQLRQNDGTGTLSLGVWNLKNQPVIYVCNDAKFEDNTLISFLDPSSIELMLNEDNVLFDYDEIDSVKLIAYDFAFVDGSYDFSTQPYYEFYGIQRDTINTLTTINGGLDATDFLLNDTAAYQTFTKDGISYMGVSSTALVDAGLSAYNMVYSPKITTTATSPVLNTLGVAVVLELTFKNGEKRLFADRFLPQIKAFHSYDLDEVNTLMAHIQGIEVPSINGINVECPLFDQQKAKAQRLMYAVRFPVVTNDIEMPYGLPTIHLSGIRIEPGITVRADDNSVGSVGTEAHPAYQTLVNLHHYLINKNINFDVFNKRLEKVGIPSLNNFIRWSGSAELGYNIETGEEGQANANLFFYTEDADGNFSAYPVTDVIYF